MALGKMMHPATNELSKNQEHAKWIIDLLGVLQEKTRGNLDANELRLLEETLNTLRLNYVEEFGRLSESTGRESLA